jgi:hypothetical protein
MPKRSVIIFVVLALATTALAASAAPRRHQRRPDPTCPLECGVKVDHRPWVYDGNQPITSVCIKAGQNLYSFTSDGSNGCFTVTGLGTKHVRVRHERGEGRERDGRERDGRGGRDCGDISNVVFYRDCGSDGGGDTPPGSPPPGSPPPENLPG